MARRRPGVLVLKHSDGREERIDLCHDVTTLGRSEMSTVAIPLPTVSRLHARIELQHDRYVLFDAGSANGTYINGKLIQGDCPLRMGDEIWVGSSDATLIFDDPEATLVLPFNVAAPLFLDERAHAVRVYGVPVALSPLEYGLLLHLAKNPGTVCTRASCFLSVWGHVYDHATCEDAVNNCVAKLRRNLSAATERVGCRRSCLRPFLGLASASTAMWSSPLPRTHRCPNHASRHLVSMWQLLSHRVRERTDTDQATNRYLYFSLSSLFATTLLG